LIVASLRFLPRLRRRLPGMMSASAAITFQSD
jgi:hypothetical protein